MKIMDNKIIEFLENNMKALSALALIGLGITGYRYYQFRSFIDKMNIRHLFSNENQSPTLSIETTDCLPIGFKIAKIEVLKAGDVIASSSTDQDYSVSTIINTGTPIKLTGKLLELDKADSIIFTFTFLGIKQQKEFAINDSTKQFIMPRQQQTIEAKSDLNFTQRKKQCSCKT